MNLVPLYLAAKKLDLTRTSPTRIPQTARTSKLFCRSQPRQRNPPKDSREMGKELAIASNSADDV